MTALSSFNTVPDAQQIIDGSVTSGSAALTSASGKFVAGDVGKSVTISDAAGTGLKLLTTIAAYVSATEVTLAAAATNSVTDAGVTWGTDCGPALQTALETVAAQFGGTIEVDGYYMLATPVYHDFLDQATQLSIDSPGSNAGMYIAVSADQIAIRITNCEMVYITRTNFIGTPKEQNDAYKVFSLEWCHVFVEKCGFYGIASIAQANGCVIAASNGQLHLSDNRFGGCACSSGQENAVIDMKDWTGFSTHRDQFLDYGLFRGRIQTKTGIVFSRAWIKIGDQFSMDPNAMRQGVVRVTDSRFDEGSLSGILIRPSQGQRVNRVHIDGGQFNVCAIAGYAGVTAEQVDELTIERCAFGLAPTTHNAIEIARCGNVVIDAIETGAGVNGLKATDIGSLLLRNSLDLIALDLTTVRAFWHQIGGYWNAPFFTKAGRIDVSDFPTAPPVGTAGWDKTDKQLYIRGDAGWYSIQTTEVDPYGNNLVVNGNFDQNVSGWTVSNSGSLTWQNGAGRLTATGNYPLAYQAVTTVPGKTYMATYAKVGGAGAGLFRIGAGPGEADKVNASVSGQSSFVATHVTTYISFIVNTEQVGASADFDGFSIRQLID